MAKKKETPAEKRIRERGDATDLVGKVTIRDKDGNIVHIPFLDKDGREILAVTPDDDEEE